MSKPKNKFDNDGMLVQNATPLERLISAFERFTNDVARIADAMSGNRPKA